MLIVVNISVFPSISWGRIESINIKDRQSAFKNFKAYALKFFECCIDDT